MYDNVLSRTAPPDSEVMAFSIYDHVLSRTIPLGLLVMAFEVFARYRRRFKPLTLYTVESCREKGDSLCEEVWWFTSGPSTSHIETTDRGTMQLSSFKIFLKGDKIAFLPVLLVFGTHLPSWLKYNPWQLLPGNRYCGLAGGPEFEMWSRLNVLCCFCTYLLQNTH
jgi:hypothetical protein